MTILTSQQIQAKRAIFNKTDISMAAAFKVLSDVKRYRIFRILVEEPKLTVSDIAQLLNISLPLTSQHLKILAFANLLQKERAGKKVFTKLERNNPFVQVVVKAIKEVVKSTKLNTPKIKKKKVSI